MAIKLRPYQIEFVQAVLREWETVRATLGIMATGCGKSEAAFGVLAEERKRCIEAGQPFRAIWLGHTSELITQPRDRIQLNWRGVLPVPGIVQAAMNEADAEIICATVQTLDARRVGKRFPVFSKGQQTKGEQKFIEADTADRDLQLFDEYGNSIFVDVPKQYELAIDPNKCRFIYKGGAPVLTDTLEPATFANYQPFAGRYEPKHDSDDFTSVEAIATDRRLVFSCNDLGYWSISYVDSGEPYLVPESKLHPLRQFKRLREILEHGRITHLVIDEAHHAPADSYRRIIRALTAVNPDLRILGVTATPERSDEQKMGVVFDSIAYRIDLFKAIYLLRCLCKYERLGFALPVDASKITGQSTTDDFTSKELAELGEIMSAHDALHIVVDKWEEHGSDRRSIFYTPTVAHATALCDVFLQRGHAAAWVSGETPKAERDDIVKKFRSGQLQVLTNCAVFAEGVDVPEISFVGMLSSTKSRTRYTQCAGRGLRNHPTKDMLDPPCIIADFTPQNSPKDLRIAGDILGTEAEQLAQVRKAKKEAQEHLDDQLVEILNEMESGLIQGQIVDVMAERQNRDIVVKRFDFFQTESPLDWSVNGVLATASVAANHVIAVISPQLDRLESAQELIKSGQWNEQWDDMLDRVRSYQLWAINGSAKLVQIYSDWEDAKRAAQIYADEHTDKKLAHASAKWREKHPSVYPKVINLARRLKVGNIEQYERVGDLSKAISYKIAESALRKAKVIK